VRFDLARVFPNINRLVLPQGVIDFEKNIPSSDVSLIALTTAVVVRKSLHPALVYILAQALAEEHRAAGFLNRAGEFTTQTDPEFPMAERAVQFDNLVRKDCKIKVRIDGWLCVPKTLSH